MDNSATSFPKPAAVLDAMTRYATELGASAGRGVYREAVETGRIIAECRQRICTLINGQDPQQVVFTLNCTHALNIALKGLIDPARPGHAICTHIDHNSILRPLAAMEEELGLAVTRVPIDPRTGLVDIADIARAIRPDTRLIAITHVSNVTGTIQPIGQVGRLARERNIPFVVDAAQSAGHLPIDVQSQYIDVLAAPGHKGLLGPLGTGFLYIRPGLEKVIRPLMEGGTGSVSEIARQPDFMPDRYESGSHNAIGLAGLSAGVAWILEQGIDHLAAHGRALVSAFIEGISVVDVPGLHCYGPPGVANHAGVFSVRVDGLSPVELARLLESRYGILTRPGIHCAPLAHNALGTAPFGGTTRFSFGPFLSVQDVTYATDALAEIAMEQCGRAGLRRMARV